MYTSLFKKKSFVDVCCYFKHLISETLTYKYRRDDNNNSIHKLSVTYVIWKNSFLWSLIAWSVITKPSVVFWISGSGWYLSRENVKQMLAAMELWPSTSGSLWPPMTRHAVSCTMAAEGWRKRKWKSRPRSPWHHPVVSYCPYNFTFTLSPALHFNFPEYFNLIDSIG